MVMLFKITKFSIGCRYARKSCRNLASQLTSYSTVVGQRNSKHLLRYGLIGATIGVGIGAGYTFHKIGIDRKNTALEGTKVEAAKLKDKPCVESSRKVISPVDTTGLQLTLYQYQTCPFCCKVRVMLDYYGISYEIVEVDPVLRREIAWSTYKKVPILLAKVNSGYQSLNDSSMIVSLLSSYLYEKSYAIEELVGYYPSIATHDDTGRFKEEIMNKYFLMHRNGIPSGKTMNDVVEERKWRQWADEVLVHVLSPNVYRTLDEAYDTFNWFSKVGNWEEYFPLWERMIMINIGAIAMWLISKRLKKRHGLKEDVRQSLYDEVNHWLRQVRARGGLFMGGENPDLSDLAVYGILKSIEGCRAFDDLLNHTEVSAWYNAMSDKIVTHSGSRLLKSE